MKNFFGERKKGFSSKIILGVSSTPTRPIMAAEISEIFKFRPKSRFLAYFGLKSAFGDIFFTFAKPQSPKI